jgi:hypothetical protein
MATWIGVVSRAVLCWTHSQMPYPAQRFFSVTNVPSVYGDFSATLYKKEAPNIMTD